MATETVTERPTAEELLETLSGDCFRDWYRERQYRENIKNGTPYFNETGFTPAPRRHSPSKLLQCHRRVIYQQQNAPKEQSDPAGIFWIGRRFEEDLAFPFLEDIASKADAYVQNTVWVDLQVETAVGDLQVKGATDPLIVDADAVPILPTEIKTKSSVDQLSAPDEHHRAQLHAYMVGLSEQYDISLTDGAIIYGCRESLRVTIFHVKFDREFWNETVLDWMTDHTEYRLEDRLPPAQPEEDWECNFCSFKERCGKGESIYANFDSEGFLPGYTGYPREKVVEYLKAHEGAQLTSALAKQYPELAEEYDAQSWLCPNCATTFSYAEINVDPNVRQRLLCPQCATDDAIVELRPPLPNQSDKQNE